MLKDLQGEVVYDIFGPLENAAYWEKCQRIIDRLPPNIKVRYMGTIDHDNVYAVLADYDLFFFPTHGENFGHVILEALISGCPVLISDQTPWRDLDQAGVGWDLPLDKPERFMDVLRKCVEMENIEWKLLSQRAGEYGERKAIDQDAIQRNIDLLTFANIS
jgi:glycosyltransferase involved in cell wall biosynthesis